MWFRIFGVDAVDGKEKVLLIDASNKENALDLAKTQGVLPYSVEKGSAPISNEKGISHKQDTTDSPLEFALIVAMMISLCLAFTGNFVFFWVFVLILIPFRFLFGHGDTHKPTTSKVDLPDYNTRNERESKLICPHCQLAGKVSTRLVQRKKGISGGKATAAVITGGLSVLATGLSRIENETQAKCSNCGSVWHY